MSESFVLSIDQGTTGTRAILYGRMGALKSSAYQEFRQYYPKPGWVEHDAHEILRSVKNIISEVFRKSGVRPAQIQSIGITNQRETIVLWDRFSGNAVAKSIVWQDRRTSDLCAQLKREGLEPEFSQKTGLLLDPYFSGTKLSWFFDRHSAVRKKAQKGNVLFGTIDSWLLYHLTGKRVHATDLSNASRTLLFDIKKKKWDRELCRILKTPLNCVPEAKKSNSFFGKTKDFPPLPDGIPIHAVMGDQQAALYGQSCYRAGDSKNTYGTGCFLLVNLGSRFVRSKFGLLTTLACDQHGNPVYALEGSIFIGGAAIQWLRDGLKWIQSAKETEAIAKKTASNDEVVVIPAFTGLGAPYWRPDVRGAILGITRGTTREMIIKATVDSIALQVNDVLQVMTREAGVKIPALKVDGGATQNRYLMQLQSDLLRVPVLKSNLTESTAWGVAKLAGYASGFWPNLDRLDRSVQYDTFRPKMSLSARNQTIGHWKQAIQKLISC